MMQQLDHDEISLAIKAAPATVYALVADVTRMPEFSPELLECRWLDGATEPRVGTRFIARNKVARGPSWRNKPVITSVQPGHAISWARTEPGGGTVEWSYRFDPHQHGTQVTESYRVTKPISRFGRLIISSMSPAIAAPRSGTEWKRRCNGSGTSPSQRPKLDAVDRTVQ